MKFSRHRAGVNSVAYSLPASLSGRRVMAVASVLIFCLGCGKKAPEFGLVEGTVKVNGQPHAKLVVRFFPDPEKGNNLSINSIGTTDAQGKYSLQHTFDGKEAAGAPVGWHRVVVEDASRGATPQGQTPPPPLVPYQFSSVATTPLRKEVEVKSGPQTIDVDVQ
jgi:hypothetical protein